MKSLSERLNELNAEAEIEPMDVSDEEKEAMKRRVRNKITQQRRVPVFLRNAVAAAVIGVASVTTIGLGFPTLASQIPLVSNIFSMKTRMASTQRMKSSRRTSVKRRQATRGPS